jgi:hypothetical protein
LRVRDLDPADAERDHCFQAVDVGAVHDGIDRQRNFQIDHHGRERALARKCALIAGDMVGAFFFAVPDRDLHMVEAALHHNSPLGCPYCSNPLALDPRSEELDTETWARVFKEAAGLGVLQVHLSGGGPGARRDLVEIAAAAHACGLYTNLITSAVGITAATLHKLAEYRTSSLKSLTIIRARWIAASTTLDRCRKLLSVARP